MATFLCDRCLHHNFLLRESITVVLCTRAVSQFNIQPKALHEQTVSTSESVKSSEVDPGFEAPDLPGEIADRLLREVAWDK